MNHATEHNLQALQFYTTADYPCSYLPRRVARSQVAAPAHLITSDVYDRLIEQGFRRSGLFTYRPQCRSCQACIPIRVDTARFRPGRTQRRTLRRHQHLVVRVMALRKHPDHYELYCRYQHARHAGAGMDEDTEEQYHQFLLASATHSCLFEFREPDGTLRIVSVVDVLDRGLSAVYTFFDPDASGSLGTYAILWQIRQCQQLGLPWLYLGYWIAESPKMAYKAQFHPCQILYDGEWSELTVPHGS
ncbi:MAG TPA: arginyltransferase [Burkholderiaceae bacterium]|nr:arginyltransferase [Burkholderiaceae bacterium]